MVNVKSIAAIFAVVVASVGAAALPSFPQKRDGPGSPYDCGCASRKAQLLAMGATSLDLAIAIQETGGKLSSGSYTYGDGKSSDSTNFGIFKNNWYMIRTSCPQFNNGTANDAGKGAILNNNDAAAIQCQHSQISKYGLNGFFAGQRDGSSGLQNPGQQTIQDYKTGVQYIKNYLDQGHLRDNMVTSYTVQGI